MTKGCGALLKAARKKANTSDEDFRDQYDLGKQLGAGAFGTVYVCTRKKDATTYAAKLMEHESSRVLWETFLQESTILRKMKHPNVIRIYDVYVDAKFTYVVMDKLSCDLMSAVGAILETGKPLHKKLLAFLFKQMMFSIMYIQSMKVIHRDVKADNFLVDNPNVSNGFDFRVVLTDFGTACIIEPGVMLTEHVGTKKYWAPEVVQKEYSIEVDTWAVGITLFGCSTGSFPFDTPRDVIRKPLIIPSSMKNQQRDLIEKILDKNRKKRMTPEEALKHPWVLAYDPMPQNVYKEAPTAKLTRAATGMLKKGTTKKLPEAEPENSEPDSEEYKALANFLKEARKKVAVEDEIVKRREQALQELNEAHRQGVKNTLRHGGKKEGVTKRMTMKLQRQNSDESCPHLWIPSGVKSTLENEERRWEWWTMKKCLQRGIDCMDSANANDETKNRLAGLEMVKMEFASKNAIRDLLQKYGINVDAFGQGEAKTLTQIEKEVLFGESYFVEGNGQIKRVVDMIVMRIISPTGRILIESQQAFSDGRVRERNLLPGCMKRPHEDQMATVKRIFSSELGVRHDAFEFTGDSFKEVLEEEKDSSSYPGLRSVYRKVFVEGHLDNNIDEADKESLGAPAYENFRTEDRGTSMLWEWLDEEECKKRGVATRGTPDTGVAKMKAVQVQPWTEELLKTVLQKHGCDIDKFGMSNSRTIGEFCRELQTGESQLLGADGKNDLVRVVDIVVMRAWKSGCLLVEAGHRIGTRLRERNVLPGTKRRPTEDVLQSAKRLLAEIHIPYSQVALTIGSQTYEEKESPSYPGIRTMYVKHMVEAQMKDQDGGSEKKGLQGRMSMPDLTKSVDPKDVSLDDAMDKCESIIILKCANVEPSEKGKKGRPKTAAGNRLKAGKPAGSADPGTGSMNLKAPKANKDKGGGSRNLKGKGKQPKAKE